jgi:hypothetical protein
MSVLKPAISNTVGVQELVQVAVDTHWTKLEANDFEQSF